MRLRPRTCRTYPNALHLVEAAARRLHLALEIKDQRLRPPLDLSRVNQAEYPAVCYQALEVVAQARSSGIVVAPAGAGTTLLVCGLVRMLPRHFKVLVTTDEKTAAQQIHAALAEALSEEKIGIHIPRRSERGRIMVTHLDALKDFVQGDLAYGGYALREFDAWICDEVHRLPAAQPHPLPQSVPADLLLGVNRHAGPRGQFPRAQFRGFRTGPAR